jgi:dihydrofolate reductase
MTRIQYYVAASLDGFIADADGGMDWLLDFGTDEFAASMDAFMASVGAIVMGSASYEFVAAAGPENWPYGDTPTWVLTHRELEAIEGADIRFVTGDVRGWHPDVITSARGGDVWVLGGGKVAAQYADANLLDEIHLTTMPVVLGSGAHVLPVTRPLAVTSSATTAEYPSGAVERVYTLH